MGKLSNKGRKIGRNKAWCEQYKREERREKSKAYRLLKHFRWQPNDDAANKAFDALPEHVRKKAKRRIEEQAAQTRSDEATAEHPASA